MTKSISKAAFSVALLLIFVKIIGFLKQSVFAAYFGAGKEMDMFLLTTEFFSEFSTSFFSSISISLLAVYLQVLNNKGRKEANVLISNVLFVGIFIIIVLVILLYILTPSLVKIIAPKYSYSDLKILSEYFRIIVFLLINAYISNLFIAILDAEKRFLPSKCSGLILSISTVFSCVMFSDKFGVKALLYGFISYYFLENLFLLFFVKKYISFNIFKPFKDKRIKSLVFLSMPLFFSNAGVMVNNVVGKAVASGLGEGIISSLSYGQILFSTTHSIIINSICTVLFSYFSEMVVQNNIENLKDEINRYLTIMVIVLLPISIIFITSAEELIDLLFGRGKFTEIAIKNTALALSGYALGLIFIAMRDILVRVHYAYQDTRYPMINGFIAIAVNIIFVLLFAEQYGILGITLGATISYFVAFCLSVKTIVKHIKNYSLNPILKKVILIVIAAFISLLSVHYINFADKLEKNLLIIFSNSIVCVAIYFMLLRVFKIDEIYNIFSLIKRKCRRS